MSEPGTICCIGQATKVNFLYLQRYPERGTSAIVERVETIAGSDAYIVGCLLARAGIRSLLWSNPVTEELAAHARGVATAAEFVLVNRADGHSEPPNYCLYDADGVRTWLPAMIAVPSP